MNISCDLNSIALLFETNKGGISGQDFIHKVNVYRAKIANVKSSTAQNDLKVVLFHSDLIEFSTRLFALALEQATILMPPNAQRQTLADIALDADFLAGDIQYSVVDNIDSYDEVFLEHDFTWPESGELWLYTSGSSGKPKRIVKTWQQINTELQTLSETFELSKDAAFLSTVSHQHIYGLLFRLLWPITRGARIFPTIEYPEHAVEVLQKNQNIVLISSPAFLNRLAKDNVLCAVSNSLTRVFSSGGPLSDEVSIELTAQLKTDITQVYGSTETGGIAYREVETSPSSDWTLFTGIEVRIDAVSQQIILSSPLLNEAEMLLEDRGAITAGKLKLLGRVDRTIKLEEKRVNLSQMEVWGKAHGWVDEIKVVPLSGERLTLGAVVIMSSTAQSQWSMLTKRERNLELRQHFLEKFELVTLPRKWRYVAEFPYNSQGKLPLEALEKLFEPIK